VARCGSDLRVLQCTDFRRVLPDGLSLWWIAICRVICSERFKGGLLVVRYLGFAFVLLLGACSGAAGRDPVPVAQPVMRWDHRPEAAIWTSATFAALQSHGAVLATLEPTDIDAWCPAYRDAGVDDRNAFWTGLLSALAKHESTYNPRAVGGGGLWVGLVQIDPRTARGYGCDARNSAALKNGAANLSCAVRIAASQVPKRNSVARGMRDWGPFYSASKRADMRGWVSKQAYCQK